MLCVFDWLLKSFENTTNEASEAKHSCIKAFKGYFSLSSCFLSSAAPPEVKNFHVAHPAAPAEPASDFIIQYFSWYFFKGEKKKRKKWEKYWVKYH